MIDGVNLRELEDTVKDLIGKVAAISLTTNDNTSEISKLKSKLELLEGKITLLNKTISELLVRIEKIERMPRTGKESERPKEIFTNQGAHIEEEEWSEMKKVVDKLKKDVVEIFKELEALKELKKRIFSLASAMEGKLDKEEFEKWKAENDFNQILNGLLKKFADKNEMLKALKKLENRILLLEEILKETGGAGVVDPGDGAMLAKKPLGGWSCASCQKDLLNIEGIRAQYHPWAKLPQRNPTERIAKVGQGFSRMLSMLKPELITKSQQVGIVQRAFYDDGPRAAIPEEGVRMTQSHGQGFAVEHDVERPSTANVFPHIQQMKVFCDILERVYELLIEIKEEMCCINSKSIDFNIIYFQDFCEIYEAFIVY